ncbi:MAG: rubrerythrin-like domain-containing protein [Halorubrum sp.]
MKDASPNSTTESAYECFECGNVVITDNSPGTCPDCAGEMRNRRMPIE